MDPSEMLAEAQAAYDRGNPRLALQYLYHCGSWRIAGGPEPEGWHGAVCALWDKVNRTISHGLPAAA